MGKGIEERLIEAALPHVVFDGWSEEAFCAAIADCAIDEVVARGLFPRGALDLAVAYHRAGDAAMCACIARTDLEDLRFRDKVAFALRTRIEGLDREAVRRACAVFALPPHAPEGARLIWQTADNIWCALGDRSEDVNWYTKRATLAAVYSSVLLYWLGDESDGSGASWQFLDRRIEDVMGIEKFKAGIKENPALSRFIAGPLALLSKIRAPGAI